LSNGTFVTRRSHSTSGLETGTGGLFWPVDDRSTTGNQGPAGLRPAASLYRDLNNRPPCNLSSGTLRRIRRPSFLRQQQLEQQNKQPTQQTAHSLDVPKHRQEQGSSALFLA
jgi:hypothetical protein